MDAPLLPPHCPIMDGTGIWWHLVANVALGCQHELVGVTVGGCPHMWASLRAGAILTLCPQQMAAGRMAVVFPGHRQS